MLTNTLFWSSGATTLTVRFTSLHYCADCILWHNSKYRRNWDIGRIFPQKNYSEKSTSVLYASHWQNNYDSLATMGGWSQHSLHDHHQQREGGNVAATPFCVFVALLFWFRAVFLPFSPLKMNRSHPQFTIVLKKNVLKYTKPLAMWRRSMNLKKKHSILVQPEAAHHNGRKENQ